MKTLLSFSRITIAVTCSLVCICCASESSQIGSGFFSSGSLDISSIDTVSVQLSTIKFDSLATSQSIRTLAGTHLDEKLGRITALTYLLPSLTETSALEKSNIFFDDLSIVLKCDGYSYYDTADSVTLNVHQLQDELDLASDGKLYNTTHFAPDETALGSLTFLPGPTSDDSIEIFLDKSFGQVFFSKGVEKDPDFESNARFRKYIKGFAVIPDTTGSGPILGFTPSPELRLYYIDRNVIPTERKYIAYTATDHYSSTYVAVNRSTTKLRSPVDNSTKLLATFTDNEAYLQAGSGLSLRIDLPHLRNLKQLSNFHLTKSVLQIQPVYKSYNRFTKLPNDLYVQVVNHKNSSMGEYSSHASLKEDLSTGQDTYYEIDATAFVKSQMETEAENENALLLLLPDNDFRVGTDRVYFADPKIAYKTRLIIYYATIMD